MTKIIWLVRSLKRKIADVKTINEWSKIMSVKIITDSASDIINTDAKNLTVLPLKISFGDEDYFDGITISHKEFYEKLVETDVLPQTSMINPFAFAEAINNVK